jgi:hypothetical protein
VILQGKCSDLSYVGGVIHPNTNEAM